MKVLGISIIETRPIYGSCIVLPIETNLIEIERLKKFSH
jgi:hypothetical protein